MKKMYKSLYGEGRERDKEDVKRVIKTIKRAKKGVFRGF